MNFEYNNEDVSFQYQNDVINLYLKADSNNKIYTIFYKANQEIDKDFVNQLCDKSRDNYLDDLIQNFYEVCQLNDQIDLKKQILSLHFKQAFKEYNGQLKRDGFLDYDEIICRCSKIDRNTLKTLHVKHHGNKSQIIKESHINMICGNCSQSFKEHYLEIAKEFGIYEGEWVSEWLNRVRELIDEFSMYSPPEFNQVNIVLKSITKDQIEIEFDTFDKNFDIEKGTIQLENYLLRELKTDFKLITSLHKPSSN